MYVPQILSHLQVALPSNVEFKDLCARFKKSYVFRFAYIHMGFHETRGMHVHFSTLKLLPEFVLKWCSLSGNKSGKFLASI